MHDAKLEACLDQLYGGPRPTAIDPMSIPCIETSDAEKLCKHPLVSVRIVTYNHEPYIRECLESVLSQKTDFEFEVLIGEDCSQDNTRAICFEYQKRYPERVRVMWAHENVYRKGGNALRLACRCRGEYVAVLEGDDYWIDNRKLQKQIDLIRNNDAIGCVADYQTVYPDGRIEKSQYNSCGVLTQADLFHFYPHTATYLFKRDIMHDVWERYSRIRGHYDVVMLHCMFEMGKVVHLREMVSTYRITGGGIATGLSKKQRQFLGIKQYLDLYLHGPNSCRHRFGSQAVTFAAFVYRISDLDLTKSERQIISSVVWKIALRQLADARTIRALLRYLCFSWSK